PATIWRVPKDDVNAYYHPTQKPLSLIAIPVKNSFKRQDIVLDLFGGSGSTLMTCDQLDRVCYTLELDPLFCDVIIERWERATGNEAILVSE
ncbi:DNA methyltransferase, partial [Enterococcus mundtii]|uniref:DNA methyltransferase n=1 Tax=Enterococcus mundtii TaxID=53346 RepID=UPI002302806E